MKSNPHTALFLSHLSPPYRGFSATTMPEGGFTQGLKSPLFQLLLSGKIRHNCRIVQVVFDNNDTVLYILSVLGQQSHDARRNKHCETRRSRPGCGMLPHAAYSWDSLGRFLKFLKCRSSCLLFLRASITSITTVTCKHQNKQVIHAFTSPECCMKRDSRR